MNLTKDQRQKITKWIENFEYYHSGINHANGGCVFAKNITANKTENRAYADIELCWQMDGRSEKYSECFYPLDEALKGVNNG